MSHADEARRLWDRHRSAYVGNLEGEGWGDVDPVAEIAAALAAAERRGIEKCEEVAARSLARLVEIQTKSQDLDAALLASDRQPVAEGTLSAIRALLPAAVAEPAAKCEKCLGSKIVCRNAMCPGGGSCCIPCPARAAGGGS